MSKNRKRAGTATATKSPPSKKTRAHAGTGGISSLLQASYPSLKPTHFFLLHLVCRQRSRQLGEGPRRNDDVKGCIGDEFERHCSRLCECERWRDEC